MKLKEEYYQKIKTDNALQSELLKTVFIEQTKDSLLAILHHNKAVFTDPRITVIIAKHYKVSPLALLNF